MTGKGDPDFGGRIYLDYAATTPLDPRVVRSMAASLSRDFGNASSLYSFGRSSRERIDAARSQLAALLGALPEEIFFTSGGSESDNWFLKGLAFALRRQGKPSGILTTRIEHHAVLQTCAWLEKQGFSVYYLPVDSEGLVSVSEVKAFFSEHEDIGIVSVMMANNEIGTIEPVKKISEICHENGAVFHTDAVQAVGHIPIDVTEMEVDALSLSAHKFYGPKGIGALYLRRGIHLDPLVHGGAQERGLRAGTENVSGIVGMGVAAEIARKELLTEGERLKALRDRLADGLLQIPGCWINGPENRNLCLPGHMNFGLEGKHHESMLIRLDLDGFAVSAGSACSAGAVVPSHVLTAMGQEPCKADAALRVTIGRYTQTSDIDDFLEELKKILG